MKKKYLNSQSPLRALFFALATMGLSGFGSCTLDTAEICSSRLPAFDQKMDSAIAALAPWIEVGRGLASDNSTAMPRIASSSPMERVDRENWRVWAEERLFEAQRYIDAIDEVGPHQLVRRELSDIASDLVSFHGYALQGKAPHMVRVLERVQAHAAKARALACPSRATQPGT